jgi:hypothetical protein
MAGRQVRALLMGGQACVFYGAAEFSRDTDVVVLTTAENLACLEAALADLQAQSIAIPPFEVEYLERGHAVHFRCGHPEALDMRLDVMSVMRGVPSFDNLWGRRTTVQTPGGIEVELLALPDLVQAKKTQRDKDWPMIRRLVEANIRQNAEDPSAEQVAFWLRECRTPAVLQTLAERYPEQTANAAGDRPLLALARGDEAALLAALSDEEQREREADRQYWAPLRAELEQLRRRRRMP